MNEKNTLFLNLKSKKHAGSQNFKFFKMYHIYIQEKMLVHHLVHLLVHHLVDSYLEF